MADDLMSSLKISAAGMRAQGTRLRVISQNIANANSLGTEPGQDPYRRKNIVFEDVLDRKLGVDLVRVKRLGEDASKFGERFDPSHPAANEAGYVKTPNVNTLIEVMDMREAQRSYEANLTAIRSARNMMQKTIDLLR